MFLHVKEAKYLHKIRDRLFISQIRDRLFISPSYAPPAFSEAALGCIAFWKWSRIFRAMTGQVWFSMTCARPALP